MLNLYTDSMPACHLCALWGMWLRTIWKSSWESLAAFRAGERSTSRARHSILWKLETILQRTKCSQNISTQKDKDKNVFMYFADWLPDLFIFLFNSFVAVFILCCFHNDAKQPLYDISVKKNNENTHPNFKKNVEVVLAIWQNAF